MPGRDEIFITNRVYHVFNKALDSKTVFSETNINTRFLELLSYYRSIKAKISFSKLKTLDTDLKNKIMGETLYKKYHQVTILAYCLMPTHFHLLVKQIITDGIERFMSNVSNAFTRYFNLKFERNGPIFLSNFKAVRIKSDEQLIHVSRYIHLNPYSSNTTKSIAGLQKYSWSSYKEYVCQNNNAKIIDPKPVLTYFNFNPQRYISFVENHAHHQRMLEEIKHTNKWL